MSIQKAFPRYAAEGVAKPYWGKLYPLEYWDTIVTVARKYKADPYLIVSIIRQESSFRARVVSPAGAVGVMQLMPRTARRMAVKMRMRRFSASMLYEPGINIEFGVQYFSRLLGTFSNRAVYALAGYNAGPNRIEQWNRSTRSTDVEEFIENIPFDETRVYVKNILRDYFHYQRLYGNVPEPDLPL
jgi:soluble lytic murein transglycosylase